MMFRYPKDHQQLFQRVNKEKLRAGQLRLKSLPKTKEHRAGNLKGDLNLTRDHS